MSSPSQGWRAKSTRACLLTAAILALLALHSCAPGKAPGTGLSAGNGASIPLIPREAEKPVAALPVNQPAQLTSQVDPVLDFAVSPDGSRLAMTTSSRGFTAIWLQSADPDRVELPHRLAPGVGDQFQPAFCPHGDRVVYVGTAHDVKGDLFLVSLSDSGEAPRRLTGRETADRAPCLSPDGRRIFFHRSLSGHQQREIAVIEPGNPGQSMTALDIPRDAAYPAVSPDGLQCAFVSSGPEGDSIYVADLQTLAVKRLSMGGFKDGDPVWSPDGGSVFFTRCTDQGQCSLWRVASDREGARPHPVTSSRHAARQASVAGSRVYFLSSRSGVDNIWHLDLAGRIPLLKGAEEQVGLARELDNLYPPDLHLAALGYLKVLSAFSEQRRLAAEAGLQAGRLYERLGEVQLAMDLYDRLISDRPWIQPQSGLAGIRLERLRARRAWEVLVIESERRQALARAENRIQVLADREPDQPRLLAQSRLERAEMLVHLGGRPGDLLRALDLLEGVLSAQEATADQQARALLVKADVFERVGRTEAVVPLYAGILERYPQTKPWSDRAVQRILDFQLSGGLQNQDLQARIDVLQRVADTYSSRLPRLAMGALNRIGDLRFQAGEWAGAKVVYQHVLDAFEADGSTQYASARLALAEILYREERFSEALELYESEMAVRAFEDYLYRLAWQGYVHKNLEAAEHHFGLGEVSRSRTMFYNLMRRDASQVQAHRGYIKAAAAQGDGGRVVTAYRRALARDPDNPVLIYSLGLSLTYLHGEESLLGAKDLIQKAIRLQGQVEFYHQTLGYVHEVLETVHGRRGQLELALEHYRKAFFLNDPRHNPRNRAHLLLNLGNVSFLLGNHDQAFEFYDLRAESGVDFQNPDTELLFYRRFGQSAFLAEKWGEPAKAFAKGLDLIEQRLEPKQASHILGRLHRFVKDRILMPARRNGHDQDQVQALFERQSEIHSRLFQASRKHVGPPPEPGWEAYAAVLESVVAEQEDLIKDLEPLVRRMDRQDWGAVRGNLLKMLGRARQELDFPLELRQVQAEMLDRLGLAYQAAGEWAMARERFQQAYALNRDLGNTSNLAPNRRSAGYNAYQQAGEAGGSKRIELLNQALADFQEVPGLVEVHGVPEPRRNRRSQGLISISLDVALAEQTASQAQYGFSPVQEKRLARAFITRIQTELGRLQPARMAAAEQLKAYPQGRAIPEKDLFGVSLLLHRSAHLESAQGNSTLACRSFLRSAGLTLEMGNPVSSALNVSNAAISLTRAPGSEQSVLADELGRLDRLTAGLLAQRAKVIDPEVVAGYHNRMGVAWAALSAGPGQGGVRAAAASNYNLARAGSHFSRGLLALKERPAAGRSGLAQEAALHLNLADLAKRGGAQALVRRHCGKALDVSKQGRLDRFQWRALAGLGRYEEAVRIASRVPLFERGCGPSEVLAGLSPLVLGPEVTASPSRIFNTLEELSELERVNRMTPLALPQLKEASLQEMRSILERLRMMAELRKRLRESGEGQGSFLFRRLEQEQELLEASLDRERAFSREFVDRFRSRERRDSFLWLAGLSAEMIHLGTQGVEQGPEGPISRKYLQAGREFAHRIEVARGLLEPGEPAGLLGVFVPAPVQAADVAASLPKGAAAFRFFPNQSRPGWWHLVSLRPSGIERHDLAPGEVPDHDGAGLRIVISEDPQGLGFDPRAPVVLSGTHLVRATESVKPFKSKVLVYPRPLDLGEAFETVALSQSAKPDDLVSLAPRMHTLLLDAPAGKAWTVPTREGQLPRDYPGLELDQGQSMDLSILANRLSNVSLAVINQGRDLPILTHLLSLFGVPTVLAPRAGDAPDEALQEFFRLYAGESIWQSASSSGSAAGRAWLQLGHWGIGPEAAAKLARQQFAAFVQSGVQAYQEGRYSQALGLFENGLLVAAEVQEFRQYEPKLLEYARESAFAAGDMKRAAEHAADLALFWSRHRPDSELHAQAMLKQGLVLARLERFDQAVPRLQQSVKILESLDLPVEQIQALSDLGTVLENATEYDRALQGFKAAASLSRDIGGRELLARQTMNIGRIHDLRLSRYALAKKAYRQAGELFRELGLEAEAAQAWLDIARCNRLLGRFDLADDILSRTLVGLQKLSGTARLQAKIVLEQASLAWFQARYQEAFNLHHQVLEQARQNDWTLEEVIALNTSGLTWWTLGKTDRALRDLQRALELAGSLALRRDEVATTLNNIGLVHREQGDFAQALEAMNEALVIDRAIGSRWAMAYDLRNIGLTHLHQGNPERAMTLLDKALAMSTDIGNRVNQAKVLLSLGNAHLQLDELEPARESFSQALTLARGMAMRETVWRALLGLGRIHILQGEQDRARLRLLDALEVIEAMRAEIKITQLRDSFLADKMEVYETLVSVLLDMGREAEAFTTAERSRARNLIDLLGNRSVRLGRAGEQALFENFSSLQASIEEQERLVAQAEERQEKAVYARTLQDLQDQAEDLLVRIQAENPELMSLVAVEPLSEQEVRELLDPKVTLLSYYLLPGEVVCWILRPDAFRTVRIPVERGSLDALVLEFRRTLQNLEPYESQARRLSALLLEPVSEHLSGTERLGVVPHRTLHYLSFAALFSGRNQLVETTPLFTLPSASILRTALNKRASKQNQQVLAVGNPALQDSHLELPFAEHEVRTIGWNFPDLTTLTREAATESRVVSSAQKFGLVHIASHGHYDPANPLLSSISLAAGPDRDGDLKASEVFGLDLQADLVVLSACQSGLGDIRAGDEVIGLNRAFMFAGTHTLVSSLWRVSDVSTAVLMKQFYRDYVRRDKAASLRRAMLHVRRYYPHPGYWAGFALVGDYW